MGSGSAPEGSGFFDILIDGVVVTDANIRGCDYPPRYSDGDLKVCVLAWTRPGQPAIVALFVNGLVGEWVHKEVGIPKVISATAVPLNVLYEVGGKPHAIKDAEAA